MRSMLAIVVVLASCGGPPAGPKGSQPLVAAAFSATRWVPDDPTYVLASPTVRAAQRSLVDLVESFGILGDVEPREVSRELSGLLGIDPLSGPALAAAGIDLEGGLVVFSQRLAPTFVVRLAAPDQTSAFFDRQRERGLVTQSVVVDGVEVFSAQLIANARASWAIEGDWLWVHFSFPLDRDDDAGWFRASRAAGGQWGRSWEWAQSATGGGATALMGFVQVRPMIERVVARLPDAARCAQLVAPVQRIAVSIEGDGTRARGAIALDVGDAAGAVKAVLLPIPEGFDAAARGAPIAAQWNLDLLAVRTWLQPCTKTIGADLAWLDEFGVRAGRAVLQSLDADARSGTGVVALDLVSSRYFAGLLDNIPLRSQLERSRTYGPLAGHSLAIPFVATVDYVLNPRLAMVAVGDGLLARVVGTGKAASGPIASIDVVPSGLSLEAWQMLLGLARIRGAEAIVGRMMKWQNGQVRLDVEGRSLVLSATGTRR